MLHKFYRASRGWNHLKAPVRATGNGSCIGVTQFQGPLDAAGSAGTGARPCGAPRCLGHDQSWAFWPIPCPTSITLSKNNPLISQCRGMGGIILDRYMSVFTCIRIPVSSHNHLIFSMNNGLKIGLCPIVRQVPTSYCWQYIYIEYIISQKPITLYIPSPTSDFSYHIYIIWLVVDLPSEKYEFVNGKDYPMYYGK